MDSLGGLWLKGSLVGKVAGAFTSSATQHGGQETTLVSGFWPFLAHQGIYHSIVCLFAVFDFL